MTEVPINSAAYAHWLQAGKPTFGPEGLWFFQQQPAFQEHMATLGNLNEIERLLAQARAIHDPDLFEAEHFGEEGEAEELLTNRLSVQAIESVLQDAPDAPETQTGRTMAGAIQAREEGAEATRIAVGRARKFLGRYADGFQGDPEASTDEEKAKLSAAVLEDRLGLYPEDE